MSQLSASEISDLDALKDRINSREVEIAEKEVRKQCRQDIAVVGGVFHPKPINLSAAMLTAKAPWISRMPKCEQKTSPDTKHKGDDRMAEKHTPKEVARAISTMAGAVTALEHSGPEDILKQFGDVTTTIGKANRDLVEVLAAFKKEGESLNAAMAETLDAVRSKRYSLVTESSQALKAMRDIRQFFLGPDYTVEIQRLERFVDLCNRLKELKESGMMDAISDTILRLAIGKE